MIGRDATPDAVRSFITANSIHKIDDEFRKGEHAAKLVAYAKGKSAEPAHMECATRSNLLQHVFNEMGYRTRKVADLRYRYEHEVPYVPRCMECKCGSVGDSRR